MWAIVIVGVDVSHVWSTLFRTYLDREEFRRHRVLLLRAPFIAFTVFFLLAGLSTLWFWRIMAYLALFHFVRQQYGFFALYSARFRRRQSHRLCGDDGIIYFATLYPVAHWHLSGERSFSWFVDGDFLTLAGHSLGTLAEPALAAANLAYWVVIGVWCIEEAYGCRRQGLPLPTGKILWLLTTAGTWYLGIIHFNSDIAFTLTNVIAHGVPYVVLVAVYNNRKRAGSDCMRFGAVPRSHAYAKLLFMVGVILFLACGEEYLWDMLLFRERGAVFASAFAYPLQVVQSPPAQALALALLSLPQVTHYIVDGFIWKNNARNPDMKGLLDSNG